MLFAVRAQPALRKVLGFADKCHLIQRESLFHTIRSPKACLFHHRSGRLPQGSRNLRNQNMFCRWNRLTTTRSQRKNEEKKEKKDMPFSCIRNRNWRGNTREIERWSSCLLEKFCLAEHHRAANWLWSDGDLHITSRNHWGKLPNLPFRYLERESSLGCRGTNMLLWRKVSS